MHKKYMEIDIGEVANLGRLPLHMHNNPIYKTALQLLDDKDLNYRESHLYFHYQNFFKKYKSLADLYDNKSKKLKKYSVKAAFLPWYHTSPVLEYEETAFIEREEKFIEEEFKKISSLKNSIIKHGYNPDKFRDRKEGHITGYFLTLNNEKKFYVVSGNHRIAIHSAVFENKKIPVIFEKVSFMKARDTVNCGLKVQGETLPKYFNGTNVSEWPAQKSCFLNSEVCLNILSKFFAGIEIKDE